jgi:hypothetical protein
MTSIFVLESVQRCTDSHHDNGGLVIIANSGLHARQMIAKINQDREINGQPSLYEILPEEWEAAREFVLLEPAEPEIIVFPNAGCC